MNTDLDALYEQFEAADYETRYQLFQQAVTHPEMDGELAFAMLDELYEYAAAANERDRFDQLILTLRENAPAAYDAEAGYMLEWQLTNALVDGRFPTIPTLIQELAQHAADAPEIVINATDQLAYYGQLAPLATLFNDAWPHIQAADMDEWVIEEFAILATNAIILHYLETAVAPTPTDATLLTQLDQYIEFEASGLAEHMAQITGQAPRAWQNSDFVLPKAHRDTEIPEQLEQNLTHLLRAFVHHLRTNEQMPLSRAGLAYWPLAELLFTHSEDLLTSSSYQSKNKQKGPYTRITAAPSPLLPTAKLLDEYLDSLLDPFAPQYYRAAALVSALPAWLRFLADQKLITAAQSSQARQQFASAIRPLREIWEQTAVDPALTASLQAWTA